MGLQFDKACARLVGACRELADFRVEDILQVGGAEAGLARSRRIDVELDFRMAPRLDVGLEAWRDDDDEQVFPVVQNAVDLRRLDQVRGLEIGRVDRVPKPSGQTGLVFIHNGDRGIENGLRHAGCLLVHDHGERVDDEHHQHQAGEQAAHLLDAEPEYVGHAAHPLKPPAS